MINLQGVTKTYGRKKALDALSLEIGGNGIYGLLGLNGAGKTTLMKVLAGHIRAGEGAVRINGRYIRPGESPPELNFVETGADQFRLRLSALIAAAAELQNDFDRDFAERMAARFELDLHKPFKSLSLGMRTMLSSILGLANNSAVVLLDEPHLGLDALMRRRFNELIVESYEAHPRLIIVSSHLIDELARVVQKLIIIHRGRILLNAPIEAIDEGAYSLSGRAADLGPLLEGEGLNCIGKTEAAGRMVAHIYGERITPPPGVSLERLSLQDFFVSLVEGANHE